VTALGGGTLAVSLASPTHKVESGTVNLHDWIDELMDALDIDTEIDEGLVLDVARRAAHRVERPAAPITTYLLGYAAALKGGDPEDIEALAGGAMSLADKWEGEEDLEAHLVDVETDAEEPELVDAD
jgi:hypothetical protein